MSPRGKQVVLGVVSAAAGFGLIAGSAYYVASFEGTVIRALPGMMAGVFLIRFSVRCVFDEP
jgi:hypothetical protein